MIQKIKKEVVRNFSQLVANVFVNLLEKSINFELFEIFDLYYDYSAQLNAYCVEFYDIYLD